MGTWLVLVSPCVRENVVATCKIGSFLCSLHNLLQKNVIVLLFGNQISKWRSFEKKRLFFYLFSHFSSHQGKVTKMSFSTYLTHIHTRILLTLLTFFVLPILKKIQIFQIRFLFGMSPGIHLIRAILEQSINDKMVSKFKLECLLLICTYTNAKFIVICKPRTLNDGGEDSVKYRNRKKAPLHSSRHFAFYR